MADNKADELFRLYSPRPLPGIPKYALVRDAIIAAIADGAFQPGEQLPTEAELVRACDFSLGTVQRALRALVDGGYVLRRQGSGTFVAEVSRPLTNPWHLRYLRDDGNGLLPVYARILRIERTERTGRWTRYVGASGSVVVRIDRLLSVNHEFEVYSEMFLGADRFSPLIEQIHGAADDDSFRTLLAQRFSLPITHIAESLGLAEVPTAICPLIGVAPGTTGLEMEAIARAGPSQFIYYQHMYIPPNPRRLHTSLSGREPERRSRLILYP